MKYSDKKGNVVEVSQEHIDTAIKIKIELQKSSPSQKCSWSQHKKMMEIEGFTDSDTNENYRQMIKKAQKKSGELPELKKYVEMVTENKLKSIREEIGEIRDSKIQAQQDYSKLNRLKKELSNDLSFLDGIESAIREKDLSNNFDFNYIQTNENVELNEMILAISDVHYGAFVDIEGRYFDTKIAEKIINEYVDKAINIAMQNNVKKIHVVGLGDYFEHDSMRIQNSYSSEKTITEQVVDFTDIIIKLLQKLSINFNVTYSAIGGNHDRQAGNKNDSIYGSHMVTISNKIVETFVKYSGNKRIEYIDSEPYHHIKTINGKNILFVHGDKTPLKKSTILSELSTLYNINFDLVVGGHIHHFTMNEVNDNKYIVTFGSIKGSDEYTLKTLNTSASRSQGIILIGETGNFEVKMVKL